MSEDSERARDASTACLYQMKVDVGGTRTLTRVRFPHTIVTWP